MYRLKSLTEIALCTAVIAVLSQLILPLPAGVPMTLQSLGVAFCGYDLGAKKGSVAVALYLLLGAVGLPVFSAFAGGFGRLIAPAGGFLWGFLPFAILCGIKGKTVTRIMLGASGLLLCHGIGIFWYSISAKVNVEAALLSVSLPTLWKDLLCLPLALFLAEKLKKILPKK